MEKPENKEYIERFQTLLKENSKMGGKKGRDCYVVYDYLLLREIMTRKFCKEDGISGFLEVNQRNEHFYKELFERLEYFVKNRFY